MLYKELHLPLDRKAANGDRIISVDLIQQYSMLFFWLQSALKVRKPKGFCPASVFLFRTQKPPEPMKKMGFDMFDNVTFKTFAIRLGKVGIIADFLENGVHYKNFADEYREYRALELHPDQFREMAARIFYTSSLIHLETSVEFFEDGVSLLWAPNRDEGFAKWNTRDYARVLAHCWQKELDAVYISPDSVWTLLRNPDGSLRHAPAFDPPKSFVAKTKKRKGASS